MNYALRMIVTARRTLGDIELANIRIAGGSLEFVAGAKADAIRRRLDPIHPVAVVENFARIMNNEFGATTTQFLINKE